MGKAVDVVFIGSCTNSRISDLRAAASIFEGRRVANGVRVLVVPGSEKVEDRLRRKGLIDLQGGGGRVAGAQLLDVHCHEWR